jgi:hypothetical protein
MTEAQLQNTAIAKLAKFCRDLSELNAADADFSHKAQELVENTFSDILGNEVFEELQKKELETRISRLLEAGDCVQAQKLCDKLALIVEQMQRA